MLGFPLLGTTGGETLLVYAPKRVSEQGLWREGTESPKRRGPPKTDRPLGVQGRKVEGRLDSQRKEHGGAQKTQGLRVSPQSQLVPPRSAPPRPAPGGVVMGTGRQREKPVCARAEGRISLPATHSLDQPVVTWASAVSHSAPPLRSSTRPVPALSAATHQGLATRLFPARRRLPPCLRIGS